MPDLLHAIPIDANAATVFRALTTRDGITAWWTDNADVTAAAGEVSVFRFGSIAFHMKSAVVEPPRRLEWHCVDGPDEWVGTRCTWDIAPSKKGVTLRFVHAGWRSAEGDLPICNTTWGHLMYLLKRHAETGARDPRFKGS